MAQERRALHRWPRSRRLRSGAVHISGRCMTMERWVRVIRACRLAFLGAGAALVATGSLEYWADGTVEVLVLALRDWLYRMDLIALERSVGFVKENQAADGFLICSGLVICVLAKKLGNLVGGSTLFLFGWLIGKRIEITVTATSLVVHRWWWNLKLPRDVACGDDLQVRVVEADEYRSRFSPTELDACGFLSDRIVHPPAIVEVVHGLRRHKVLMPRHEDRAEAIVARCSEALTATRELFSIA